MPQLFAAVLSALCSVASAATLQDERPDTILKPGEVTVTARRIPLATQQTIRGEDLQALSSTSIADALKYFAGVQIKDYGGLGGLKTINVRSLGSQHVGVYIDGIRLTNAQNGTIDLGKYSLSTLESVSLYNANRLDACQSASEFASGATVYLQTRRPERDSLSLLTGIGSFHTYRARVNLQTARKGWSAFVDLEGLSSRGDYPFRYKSQYEDTVGTRRNSDIKYFRGEAALFKNGFASHLYFYTSERGCPGGIVRRLSDKYKFNIKYTHEYLRYKTDYPENRNTARYDNHYYQNDAFASATPYEGLNIVRFSDGSACKIYYKPE